jgi:hypothetical protein
MLSVCVGVGVAVSFTLIACDGDRVAALAIRSGLPRFANAPKSLLISVSAYRPGCQSNLLILL